jgi:poly-beta-hydroxyalkanoate depolymerase
VPLDEGAFTLDHYVDYVRGFMRHIGQERLHVLAVCSRPSRCWRRRRSARPRASASRAA